METTTVQATYRDMWETRPARPRESRQVAGVAAAIARRYDVDPVLVRIGFVVAGFLGVGAAFYIAGWILLPEAPADPHAPPGPTRWSRAVAMLGLAVAGAVTLGMTFDHDGWDGGVVLPVLAVLGLLFLLHRSRADRGTRGTTGLVATTPTDAQTVATDAAAGPLAIDPVGYDPLDPAAYVLPDPVGYAPFTEPVPLAPRRRRHPITPVTVGLALLAGGATALILLLADALSSATLPLLLGIALAVLGSGLVIGAFLRAGRGLIPIALVLAAITWGTLSVPPDGWRGGFGDLRAAPTTVAALQPVYERAAGDIRLDLRGLDLSTPLGGASSPVRSSVSLGAGDVEVLLPADADLRLTAAAGIGQVFFGTRAGTRPASEFEIVNDLGADGVQSGRLLVLDIETGAGDVEVRRG